MTQVNLNSPVGNWVASHPQTSRVFEALRIDYCCGGGTSLEQACWDRGLDPHQVLQQLDQAVTEDGETTEDWLNASLAELVRQGEITAENAYRFSINPKGLDKLLL